MPVVSRRVGDDAEEGIVDLDLPARDELHHDARAGRVAKLAVEGQRGTAKALVVNLHDADLGQPLADLRDGAASGERPLHEVTNAERSCRLGCVVGAVLGIARQVVEADVQPRLVKPVGPVGLAVRGERHEAVLAGPGHAAGTRRRLRGKSLPAGEYCNAVMLGVAESPLHGAGRNDGAILRG